MSNRTGPDGKEHTGSCRVFYFENRCTCGAGEQRWFIAEMHPYLVVDEDDRLVATFIRPQDAQAAVQAHNAALPREVPQTQPYDIVAGHVVRRIQDGITNKFSLVPLMTVAEWMTFEAPGR